MISLFLPENYLIWGNMAGANGLTAIPPLISRLRNLRELNVSNNRLKYLPCEILDLRLSSLSVEMNHFIEYPFPSYKQKFGPITRRHTIMPMTELALRVLLQPIEDSMGSDYLRSKNETVLEALYDMPLDADLSPNLKAILSACLPGSVAAPLSAVNSAYSPSIAIRTSSAYVPSHPPSPTDSDSTFPCISKCPSPRHLVVDIASTNQYRVPVFVDHAEERLSWEREIAGCKVGGETGVPVLWRGCSAGCLDGLSEEQDTIVIGGNLDANDDDGDWDMDDSVQVPVIQHADDSDGEGLFEAPPAAAPFTSDGFEFDD